MKTLTAKAIINDQYWVITDGEKKVGNVLANAAGFSLILEGSTTHFDSTDDIRKKAKIRFEPLKTNKKKAEMPYPEYPTSPKTYNNILDVKRKLHLFTKSSKSKCYHAAGWFVMDTNGTPKIEFCPKYIFIQRYDYKGPFKSQSDAEAAINTQT